MKRFLAVFASLMLVLGFAASAFAIHAEIPSETKAVVAKGTTQVTLGGEIRFRGEYQNNTDLDSNNEPTDSFAAYDSRVRLRIQADVSKNTTGVVHLETGSDPRDGSSSNTSDTYTWGVGGSENTGTLGQNLGNGKRGTLNVLEAWIQHKGSGLLGIPAGIKIGHMPVVLGYGLFYNHGKFGDDAIYLWINPVKKMEIGLMGVKLAENTRESADDADMYTLLLNYDINKDSKIGFDASYLDLKRVSLTSTGVSTATASDKGTKLWNFGLRGNTKVAGLGIKADIELQSGDYKPATGNKIKARGYAYMVGLDYKLNPVTLSLDYAYGSGDGNPNDTKNKLFLNTLSNTQKYTYVYDFRAPTATGSRNTGLANTQYWKLGANADLTKNLNADVNLYLLRAAKKTVVSIGGNPTKGDSKNLGTEIDWKATYKIDKNLTYFVEGGYLWTGGFYDSATVASDNAYAIRHGIQLKF